MFGWADFHDRSLSRRKHLSDALGKSGCKFFHLLAACVGFSAESGRRGHLNLEEGLRPNAKRLRISGTHNGAEC